MKSARKANSYGVWPKELIFDPILALRQQYKKESDGSLESVDVSQSNAKRDVTRAIINAIGGITTVGPREGIRWRGQGSLTHRIESTATRRGLSDEILIKHELEMLRTARRIGMGGAQHLGDWEILARLRHSGAANRLIDVTSDPFVALFMLCDTAAHGSETQKQDGALIAINQSETKQIDELWKQHSYEKMVENTSRATLLFSTPPIDPRIAAQRGAFILSTHPPPKSKEPTTELFPTEMPPSWSQQKMDKMCGYDLTLGKAGRPQVNFPNIFAIRIPHQAKGEILQQLSRNFGYTRDTIYPDWAGIAESYGSSKLTP